MCNDIWYEVSAVSERLYGTRACLVLWVLGRVEKGYGWVAIVRVYALVSRDWIGALYMKEERLVEDTFQAIA
jgi:hypothetical protein